MTFQCSQGCCTCKRPLKVTFGLSSRESQVVESEKDATLDTGHIYVTYSHQFIYAETLYYNITNNGFAGKTVYGVALDEKTGEVLDNYPVYLAPGASTGGFYSIPTGLWRQEGHENIRVTIRLEGEDISDLNSTRFTSFKSLEEIYLQDISGMPMKNNAPSNDEDDVNSNVVPVVPENLFRHPLTSIDDAPEIQACLCPVFFLKKSLVKIR